MGADRLKIVGGAGADGSIGNGPNNGSIWAGGVSLRLGFADMFPFPLPGEFHGGGSYTWTTP